MTHTVMMAEVTEVLMLGTWRQTPHCYDDKGFRSYNFSDDNGF